MKQLCSATCYDKTVLSFQNFPKFATARLCLKSFVNTAGL